jgi:LuxR family maltose regulon positive regulatory protein
VETSLLTTKLNIPPSRPQIVPRPHLYERLQDGLNYNLILVSAPAGFGKTTLVSEWVRQNQTQVPVAWLSLDEGDNDPVRFWDYFIAALRTLYPDCGKDILPLLHSPQPPPAESLLTVIINDLAGIKGDFIIALDDYHFIESKEIHNSITYLLEHMPAQMHLIISSRADLPLPLARYRAKRIMLEIVAEDLRFFPEDAAGLLKKLKVPGLSVEDVTALNERTEGWVAGLIMAALSMSGQKDIPAFIADFTGSQRYVMDYLLEEVLQKQPDEIRDFLLKTSVLRRLCSPLCDTITGGKNSRDILLNLERGHLFIIPLDESRQWYRYEHLFADLLRHQCEMVYGKEEVAGLHRCACQWYEGNNLPDDAIHHALSARDWNTAMRLILPRSEELRNQGEWNTVLGWLKAIPNELIREHHRLYCQYAGCLFTVGESDAAEAVLSYLENAAQDDALLQADVAFLMGDIAWVRHDIERAVYLSEKSLSLLPKDNLVMRSRATLGIGLARYLQNDLHEAEKLWTETYEMALQGGDIFLASATLALLGNIKGQITNLDGAVELYNKAIEIAGQTQGAAGGQAELSRVLYERNDLEAAAENALLAVEWFERGGIPHNAILANFIRAQVCTVRGDVAGAVAAMERMDRAGHHPALNPLYHASQAAFHVLFAIRQNDMEAADKWSKKLSEYSDALFVEYRYIPARLLIAQGRKEEAAEYLHDLYETLVRADAYNLTIEVRMCQALAAESEESAMEFLSDALKMAEPEGYIRTFVDEGKLLKTLLEKALSRGVTPEYTRKLITIIEAEERQKLKRKKEEGAPFPYSSLLSERELEVLRLMAEGLSNQQIAERLIISLGTTKNHVHNILEKLNAEGRTQAVAQARELELI